MTQSDGKVSVRELEDALWKKFCPFFNGRCRPDCMLLARLEVWSNETKTHVYVCGLVVSGNHPNAVEVPVDKSLPT